MSGFDLNYWIGFFLSAVIFSIFFYGISIAQTLYYYRHYPEDSRLLKAYVLGLLMLDFGRTVLDVAIIWFWTIEHHGDVGFLLICPPSFATEFLFSKLTIIAVQGFFINTIWRLLAGNRYRHVFTLLGVVLALLGFSCGIAQTANMYDETYAYTIIPNNLVSGVLGLGASFVADIYITVALCMVLHEHKTGLARTENMISSLMTFAVTRGIVTALFQLASCISYGAAVHSEAVPWALTIIPGNSIYVNSMLASLNIRQHVRGISGSLLTTTGVELNTIGMQINTRMHIAVSQERCTSRDRVTAPEDERVKGA